MTLDFTGCDKAFAESNEARFVPKLSHRLLPAQGEDLQLGSQWESRVSSPQCATSSSLATGNLRQQVTVQGAVAPLRHKLLATSGPDSKGKRTGAQPNAAELRNC